MDQLIKEIETLCKQECNKNKNVCKIIIRLLEELILNYNVPNDLIEKYIDHLIKNKCFFNCYNNIYPDNRYNCVALELCKEYLINIFTIYVPTIQQMEYFISYADFEYEYLQIFVNLNQNFKDKDYNNLLNIVVEKLNDYTKTHNFIKPADLNSDIKTNNFIKLNNLIRKYSGKIDKTIIKEFCLQLPESISCIELLKEKGFQITRECLNYITQFPISNITKLTYILDHKIPISRKIFENILKYNSQIILDNLKLLDICISYGYIMELDDIKLCIENKKDVPNLERFEEHKNICENKQILDLCYTKYFYPNFQYQNDNYKLEKACAIRDTKEIKKILNKGIKPTNRCLENACKIPQNIANIKELIKFGCEVNIQCIKNSNALNRHNNTQLNLLISNIKN